MILGYSNFQSAKIVVPLAKEAGLFAKHGIDLEMLSIPAGQEVVPKLLSGVIHFFLGNSYPVVRAIAIQGAPLAIIASLGNVSFQLVAHSSIQSPEALKGKRIGIGGSKAATDRITYTVLKALGLEPYRDVEMVSTGLHDSQMRLDLLLRGEVDATLVGTEHTKDMRTRNQQICVLADLDELGISVSGSDIAVSREFVARHRDQVKGFLKALLEAILLAKSDPNMAREMYRQFAGISDPNVLDWLVAEYVHARISMQPYPNRESLTFDLREEFPGATIDVETLIDGSLIGELTEDVTSSAT